MSDPNDQPAVTKLAAKVAHELNNPLDAVLRFVGLAQRKVRSGDYADLDRYLADAQFGLERMAETLRELMELGRQTHEMLARPEPLPLSELIAQATRIAAAQAEERRVGIAVRSTLKPGMTPRYDQRLVQVLANLLKNALEAAPPQGTVRLTVAPHSAAPVVVIAIEDSGPGIAPQLLPHLFTSFQTTKPGVGHGLGLAISRELVISLGGTLTVENRTGGQTGCTATITLPLT